MKLNSTSTSYHLYGSTKSTTDQTGNPFAYNGEARDITGLDYLRARYYDHQVGTFLIEDSYQGDDRDPLSQNLCSYVQNNPVNYTDPSYRPPASYYAAFGPHAAVYQPAQRTSHIYSQQQQRQPLVFNPLTALQQAQANGQSTYNWGKSKSKEARNIHRNWTLALEETQKHVCDPKRMKAGDKSSIRPSKKQLQDLQERISKDDKTAILQLIKGS